MGNQRGIMCDGCSQSTHARCGSVGEAEYLLLTAEQSSKWFCPLNFWLEPFGHEHLIHVIATTNR